VVSIITIAASLVIRSHTLSFVPVAPFATAIVALITGAMVAAWIGTTLFGRLSDARLEQLILVLLLVVGVALIVEGFLPGGASALLSGSSVVWIAAGCSGPPTIWSASPTGSLISASGSSSRPRGSSKS
jgi:predicted MFS family arabinose efflux permease